MIQSGSALGSEEVVELDPHLLPLDVYPFGNLVLIDVRRW